MKKTISVVVALVILALSAMPAFALPSPTASKEYNIIIHKTEGGSGTYTTKIDKDGKHAKIIAHPKNGYEFVKWIPKGKYEIDGKLTDKTLSILLKSDVEFTPVFKKKGTSSSSVSPSVSQNDSPVSPKTGDSNAMYFFFGTLAALAIALGFVGVKLAFMKK